MRNATIALVSVGALALALGGCASTGPAQPRVSVMPGKGKSYPAFQRDDDYCQERAQAAVGYRSPGEAANNQVVGGAAVGTALGALAGAAIGAVSGNAGTGAAIGAASGLAGGTIVGGANARGAGGSIQHRYDMVYAQCMTARGNRVAEPEEQVVVVESSPVYVAPRPYCWGPGPCWAPGPYYRRGWW